MFVIRQQSVVERFENHRYTQIATPITLHTRGTYFEAAQLVYANFAESEAKSHYAVISSEGKFIRAIKLGSLDGFRKPGVI